jgi:RHS repeat-associated protein
MSIVLPAAKEKSLQPPAGLLARLAEKPHPGLQPNEPKPHWVDQTAKLNIALGFPVCVYDFCSGPLSTGYFRDAPTGLDYADQRYHQPGAGRFMTPDRMSGNPTNPGAWNKYAYVGGDPVNRTDSSGNCWSQDGGDGLTADDYPCAQTDDTCTYQDFRDGGGCGGDASIVGVAGPPPPPPAQPLWTWSIDVGYTPTVNLRGNRNSYDHLFIWIHPTGDSNPADGEVFDGGPTGNCASRAGCGNTTAWVSEDGHYNELTNPAAVDFFQYAAGAI